LEETGTLESKPIDTPIDSNICFDQNLGEPLADPRQYRQLIGKLIYLTITRLILYLLCGCVKLIYTEFISTSLDCYLSYLAVS